MSLIRDISESHDLLKCIAISLIVAPLWYISIYLIHPELFEKTDFIFKVIFCSVNSLLTAIPFSLFLNVIDEKKNSNLIESSIVSTLIVFLYKSFYLFIIYSILFLNNKSMYFYWYIVLYYIGFILLIIAVSLLDKLLIK